MWYGRTETATIAVREPGFGRERDLVRAWLRLPAGTELSTIDGRSLVILKPGHRNRNAGPDISRARLFLSGAFVTGSVEFHVRSGDWYTHGHHQDSRYNQVVLHVVSHLGKRVPSLPTVVLKTRPFDRSCPVTTQAPRWESTLKVFGSRRWANFMTFYLENPDPGHLWRRCLHLLGKGGNEEHFEDLSRRISWDEARDRVSGEAVADQVVQFQIPWNHCSIRPAAWPERRLPFLHDIGVFIGRLVEEGADLIPVGVPAGLTLPGAPSLEIELAGNCWIPWLAARQVRAGRWRAAEALKLTWEGLRLTAPYGVLRRRWGKDSRLKNYVLAQGGLSLNRTHCIPGACHRCPLQLYTHDLFN
ncbi:MAG: DUF2851 family protein [Fidelibacterota bacterium]